MIPLEGRVLAGLDEFMLRLGHLTVLCEAASRVRSSWKRITNEAADTLTKPVSVEPSSAEAVAQYLFRKKLCPVVNVTSPKQAQDFRYPTLTVEGPGKNLRSTDGKTPAVWWQDFCLAAPEVRSRVGTVSSTGKSGSKTALSHVCDWAALLDLITPSAELSHAARLLIRLDVSAGSSGSANPYIHGCDRIVFAVSALRGDFDLFARFAPKLIKAGQPIRKSTGRELFAETIEQIAIEAERARHLSSSRQYKLFQQLRELEKTAARSRKETGETSTAWHRAASRLETYVDLGLLEKARRGEEEKYEYVYYSTSRLEDAVDSVAAASSAEGWVEEHLIRVLFGKQCRSELHDAEITSMIRSVSNALELPTRVFPIDVVAQGLAWLKAKEGAPISLGTSRTAVEEFAKRNPDQARLSRGSFGDRAEFVSIQPVLLRN
ncbi:MAG: hypothetical protein JO354_06755 [Verrucomicrobia bacterium]|nr:hypothetical protein [Verrucomicrobiota bacterium]